MNVKMNYVSEEGKLLEPQEILAETLANLTGPSTADGAPGRDGSATSSTSSSEEYYEQEVAMHESQSPLAGEPIPLVAFSHASVAHDVALIACGVCGAALQAIAMSMLGVSAACNISLCLHSCRLICAAPGHAGQGFGVA